ncbi:bifunctional UDP-N-acetylglucosamine diphosphorylase/glucosamine-1-phosphate N-acetyltransferase GlmU [Desulfovibrio sp. OttesenSCG-928-A18]|nr:bifunctional UDP-N-acetylglucosamine diphosphorylase/glucosamine-1-phosphate N-acetyltransferase GlmU [Desulfovibrio sp. OttesenSCG-928-A18]
MAKHIPSYACNTNAGQGLLRILEEPMLRYVLDKCKALCGTQIRVVIGHGARELRAAFPDEASRFILQEEQLGTGHALQCAWPFVQAWGLEYLLVVNGDTPLLPLEEIRLFAQQALTGAADIAFATMFLDDPGAFGRVVRNDGDVTAIVEAKEYDEAAHGPATGEVNAGVYCLRAAVLKELLPLLTKDNAGAEYYITDLVGLGVRRGLRVFGYALEGGQELLGINTPEELARAEEGLRAELVRAHQARGVIIRAADSVRIGPYVEIAPGADITGPCEIYGASRIGPQTHIASHCRLQDAVLERGAKLHSFSHVQSAQLRPLATAGPFARLRPGALLEEDAHVGNFVEVKKSRLGKGAKAGHLSYIGDSDVGAKVNIGAGTITCNYDGREKHQTRIGDGAFIGSNTALVAPVSVGAGSLIGAGSVITKDVPDNHLGITRAMQKNLPRHRREDEQAE